MSENNIDLSIITDDDSIYYFTGYHDFLHMDFNRPTLLVVSNDHKTYLITPLLDVLLVPETCPVDKVETWNDGIGNEWRELLPQIINQHKNIFIEKLIEKKNFDPDFVSRLPEFGFSAIANILASIKLAKYMDLNSDDAIITVATDGADLYMSELNKTIADFKNNYDEIVCAELFGQHLSGVSTDNMLELSHMDKKRIFNLGYFTWVEQQGVSLEEFEKRKDQKFWNSHYDYMLSLDNKIKEFNNM